MPPQLVPSPLPSNLASHNNIRGRVSSSLAQTPGAITRLHTHMETALRDCGWTARTRDYVNREIRRGRGVDEVIAAVRSATRRFVGEAARVSKGEDVEARYVVSDGGVPESERVGLELDRETLERLAAALRRELGPLCKVVDELDWEY